MGSLDASEDRGARLVRRPCAADYAPDILLAMGVVIIVAMLTAMFVVTAWSAPGVGVGAGCIVSAHRMAISDRAASAR